MLSLLRVSLQALSNLLDRDSHRLRFLDLAASHDRVPLSSELIERSRLQDLTARRLSDHLVLVRVDTRHGTFTPHRVEHSLVRAAMLRNQHALILHHFI